MSKDLAISLRSRWLSDRLKRARSQAGYSLAEASDYIQVDHTTLGRFERGINRIRRPYVKDLLDFYGVSNERERDYLLQLAEDAWRKDWSDMDRSDLESDFIDLTWLEAKAVNIRVFEPLLIHGLLQTADYIRELALSEQGEAATSTVVERITEVRQARQRALAGEPPTQLTVILEEPALRRLVGGKKVLRGQLEALLAANAKSHVNIRVLPMTAGHDPGHHGPFALFGMPDPYPEIAYLENLTGRFILEDQQKVARCNQAYDDLCRLALPSEQSTNFIRDVLRDQK